MESILQTVDSLEGRVTKVENRQDELEQTIHQEFESSKRQRLKLFALSDELKKSINLMREERVGADAEKNKKLDNILSTLKAHEDRDVVHDKSISYLQQEVTNMVNKEIKDKGLPSSGKKLYAGAGIAGALSAALGTLLYTLLDHLPEIADTVIRVLREIK